MVLALWFGPINYRTQINSIREAIMQCVNVRPLAHNGPAEIV